MATIVSPVERTRYLIARSDQFRSAVGATSGTEPAKLAAALERIASHQAAVEDMVLPCAIVEFAERRRERKGTGGGVFIRQVATNVTFYAALDTDVGADTESEQMETFDTLTENIMDDMMQLSGSADHIYYDTVDVPSPPIVLPIQSREAWLVKQYKMSGPMIGSQTE